MLDEVISHRSCIFPLEVLLERSAVMQFMRCCGLVF